MHDEFTAAFARFSTN